MTPVRRPSYYCAVCGKPLTKAIVVAGANRVVCKSQTCYNACYQTWLHTEGMANETSAETDKEEAK